MAPGKIIIRISFFLFRSPGRKKRERSPPPRPTRIHIGRLTLNVTRDHIHEIFSTYGTVKSIEFPMDRLHPHNGRGYAYVEFNNADEAENAMKHMDGGNQLNTYLLTLTLNIFLPVGKFNIKYVLGMHWNKFSILCLQIQIFTMELLLILILYWSPKKFSLTCTNR